MFTSVRNVTGEPQGRFTTMSWFLAVDPGALIKSISLNKLIKTKQRWATHGDESGLDANKYD